MRFLDLFAGIGGFRLGMEQAGHECVGYVEWDKYARKSYEAIHDTEGEWTAHDITTVTDGEIEQFRGTVDVICGGFPCQSFSIQGARRGFEETRGTLFFEIVRFAKIIQPKYLFLENVKGLLNHDRGNTFRTILGALDELGYDAEWQILHSKNFGVPQARERVYIIGHLRGQGGRRIFPIEGYSKEFVGEKKALAADYRYDEGFRVRKNGLVPTLTANNVKMLDNGLSSKIYVWFPETNEIRLLTPKKAWRAQSFPDSLFDKARIVNEVKQLYKQAGNSVTVNVIHEIAKRL